MPGIMPCRSLIRTKVLFSLLRMALRSAALMAFSNAAMVSRAETPLFLSTYSLPLRFKCHLFNESF